MKQEDELLDSELGGPSEVSPDVSLFIYLFGQQMAAESVRPQFLKPQRRRRIVVYLQVGPESSFRRPRVH